MSVYLIAEIKVTNDAWLPAYVRSVHDIVHRHGGKYLSRSGKAKTLEGERSDSDLIALIEFPSEHAVNAFANDPQYWPFAEARQRGSRSRLQYIDGSDLAGTIGYLPKA